MRMGRRPTTFILLLRYLVLSFVGRSALIDAAMSSSPSDGTPQQHGGRTLRFARHPPPSSVVSSTDHSRRRVAGVGRSRHGDVLAFHQQSPRDVTAATDSLVHSVSAGNDVITGVNEHIISRVNKHRTDADTAAAVDNKYDTAAATARRRLPDVIIIGAKKSGTRALLEFLKIHPDIRAAGPETHFFDRFYDRGLDWYRSRMPATTSGQLTVEKTPSYLVSGRVVERIFMMDPAVRLLLVVRDPVTRAVSDYTQAATKRPDIAPFEQLAFITRNSTSRDDCWTANETGACQVNRSWGAIRIGLYIHHISRWLRRFSRSQIHFVHGEQLVRDPAGQMRLVERFLRLRPVINESNFKLDPVKGFPCIARSTGGEPPQTQPRCLGKTKGRIHPKVADAALRRLRDFFRPFNQLFYQVVGVDFSWA